MKNDSLLKIKDYINKRPESYIGYYAKGLLLLDKYVLSENIYSKDELLSSFRTAINLSNELIIKKYYFVALILCQDVGGILNFNNLLRDLSVSDLDGFLLIFLLQQAYRQNFSGKKFKIDEYQEKVNGLRLDSVDYLILYSLEKAKGISLIKDCNYMLESVNRGRKTNKLIEVLFTYHLDQEFLTDENINKYINQIAHISNMEILKRVLKSPSLNNINSSNIQLIEKIIIIQKENEYPKDLFRNLVKRYIKYCLFSGKNSKLTISELKKILVDDIDNYTNAYFLINSSNSQDKLEKLLENKTHYSKQEIEYIQRKAQGVLGRQFTNLKIKNLYELSINLPIDVQDVIIQVKFEDYKIEEIFNYYASFQNYYHFPDKPTEITLIRDGIVLECKYFSCNMVQDFRKIIVSLSVDYIAQYIKLNNNFQSACDRFLLFSFFNLNYYYISHNNEVLIEYLIDNKILFSQKQFISILQAIKKWYNNRYSKGISQKLYYEIAKYELTPETVHRAIASETEYEKAMQALLKAKQNGTNIQIKTFYKLVHMAITSDILDDIRLGVMCEQFVYEHSIINDDILKYLESAYINNGLCTEYTSKVIDVLSSYYNDELIINKLIMQSYLNRNDYEYDFYRVFLKVYEVLGPNDQLVNDSINRMIHSGKYYYNNQLNKILCNIYMQDQKNYRLLEEIVYRKIVGGKSPEEEFISKLKDYYLKYQVFSNRTKLILTAFAKTDFGTGLEEFLLELLKYEILDKEQNSKDRLLYRTEKHSNWIQIRYTENQRFYAVPMSYTKEYYTFDSKANKEKVHHRKYIEMNLALFEKWYGKLQDDKLEEFVIQLCIEKEIYNKNVLVSCIEKDKKDENTEKAYKILIKGLSAESPKTACKYIGNYINKFNNFAIATNMINELSKKDLEKATEIFTIINSPALVNHLKYLALKIVKACINEGKFELAATLFKLYLDDLEQKMWHDYLLKYISLYKTENSVSDSFKDLIIEIIKKYNSSAVGKYVKEVVCSYEPSYDNTTMLYALYKCSNDKKILEKVLHICIDNYEYCIEELKGIVIDNIRFNPIALKNFIRKCSINNEEQSKKLFEIADQYFNADSNLSKEILSAIMYVSEEARFAIEKLNDKSSKIIGRYYVAEVIEKGKFCARLKLIDLFTHRNTIAIKLNSKLDQRIKEHFKKVKSADMQNIEDYYVIKSDFNEVKALEAMEFNDCLNGLLWLLELENIMLSKGLSLVEIYPQNVIISNKFIMPFRITELHKFDKFTRYYDDLLYNTKRQKQKISKKSKFLDLYETDIIDIFICFINNILKDEYKESTAIKEILEVKKYTSLSELKSDIELILINTQIINNNDSNEEMIMQNLEIATIQQKESAALYAIKNNISNFDLYEYTFLIPYEFDSKFKYLIQNYRYNNKGDSLCMAEFLMREGANIKESDENIRKEIVNFIRNAYRNKHLSKEKIVEIKVNLSFLTIREKQSINYILEGV